VSDVRIALTFDAEHPDRAQCPPGNQERLLDALNNAGVRATFFLQGRWVTAYPETARRMAAQGHLIGNHSNYHARMPLLSDEGLRTDVLDADQVIRAITGVDARPWFRCPFGAGYDDPRVLAALAAMGYRNVHWDVLADDWENEATGPDVEEAVVRGCLQHGDGAVVLLHAWPGPTLAALPGVVSRLRAEGATFVRIDEVLGGQ
jgi:peptidoglycan-N-acetylglucosamine deacetylase